MKIKLYKCRIFYECEVCSYYGNEMLMNLVNIKLRRFVQLPCNLHFQATNFNICSMLQLELKATKLVCVYAA